MSHKKHIIRIEELEGRLTLLENPQNEAARLEKVDVLTMLAREIWHTDVQRGLAAAQEAYELASIQPVYKKGIAESLFSMGDLNNQISNHGEALSQLNRALELFKELKLLKQQADALFGIGAAYHYIGGYPEAMEALIESFNIYEKLGIEKGKANSLNDIALIHQVTGEIKESIDVLEEALSLFREINHEVHEATVLNNQAISYMALKKFPKALECAHASLKIFQRLESKNREAVALCTLGEIHLKAKEYELALPYFKASIEKGNKFAILHAFLNLGNLFNEQNDLDNARASLQQALSVAQEAGAKAEEAKVHQYMAEIYKKQKNFEKALKEFEKFHFLDKEIFNSERDTRIKNLQILHQTEASKQEAEIYRLQNMLLEEEIMERKALEKQLQYTAVHDHLTGLPNRMFFFEELEKALRKAKQNSQSLAIFFIDLDNFKPINDTYGHEVGDQVLVNFARRLKKSIRKSDIVARLAGDEFTILIENIRNHDDAIAVAEKIVSTTNNIYQVGDGENISLYCSIGISLYPKNGMDAETLLQRADQAMYEAKGSDIKNYTFFQEI